ncbi:MAG: heat shock protein HspQ [Planctomycetes bacterium]|nr:heat shock protein HspQ [Planctomycetota bacterium]
MIVSSGPPANFRPGQLVRHKRYGYRGVVVEVDPFCKAPDSWYEKNRTQPLRDQPWYHVLVDASSNITYAAQTSLEEADQIAPITHPLVDVFFSGFEGESYVRNDHPWPGQWE